MTDKYCPYCLCKLRKGSGSVFWCPDQLTCGYEFDLYDPCKKDPALGENDAKMAKFKQLEKVYLKIKSEYEEAKRKLLK